mgnify:CR=1 FL=1
MPSIIINLIITVNERLSLKKKFLLLNLSFSKKISNFTTVLAHADDS